MTLRWKLLLVLLLAAAALGQEAKSEEGWKDFWRFVADLLNTAFLALEHCGADAEPHSCTHFLAGVGFAIVLVFLCIAVGEGLGITASQEPHHKRRRQTALDGLRVAGLAANLQKVHGWYAQES